jgi:hypothetical protein
MKGQLGKKKPTAVLREVIKQRQRDGILVLFQSK